MPTPRLSEGVLELLRTHAATYQPRYSPASLSDHGPMACLALHGLGASEAAIARFATGYARRLETLPPAGAKLGPHDWHEHVGHPSSYPALRTFFGAELRARGLEPTLARYLPSLASGWVIDLFHPMIRLSYGVEFGVESEVAAGLAYLACAGSDANLALAARLPPEHDGATYLRELTALGSAPASGGPGAFNRRYRSVSASGRLYPAAGTPDELYRSLSRACLEVFHGTRDFFALHLVTGSHAFRVCAPWIGPHAASLFSIGLGAAYLAAGAPASAAFSPLETAPSIPALTFAADEHVVKLAYTCKVLSRLDGDDTYAWIARRELERPDEVGSP